MNQPSVQAGSFDTLGIAPKFLEILKNLNFATPTPIQEKAIPIAIEGKDIIGIAQTGTGKTLAFGIPMIQRLAKVKGKGLVVLPTRELAIQVNEVLQKIGASLGLRTAVLIGGAPMGRQLQDLQKTPHIVVATPGRLLDHVLRRTVHLGTMTIVVLDEADRMLDMGFAPQIKKILNALPKERHIMLFSATIPQDIIRLATQFMKLPLQIEIARSGTVPEEVDQELFMVRKEDKLRLLDTLLSQHHGTILVFSRTKHGAKKIYRAVMGMGHTAAELHANRSLNQRKEALAGFKSGKYRVLVATDIAARGIDVIGIELVINFDIPEDPEDYVHRVGRTGRAGQAGKALTFVAPDQRGKVRDIERLTRKSLTLSQTPQLAPARPMPSRGHAVYGGRPRLGGHDRVSRVGQKTAPDSSYQSEDDRFFSRSRPSRPFRDNRRSNRGSRGSRSRR